MGDGDGEEMRLAAGPINNVSIKDLAPGGDVVDWSRGSPRGVLRGLDGGVGKGMYERPGIERLWAPLLLKGRLWERDLFYVVGGGI
jgi:hypothetical protein